MEHFLEHFTSKMRKTTLIYNTDPQQIDKLVNWAAVARRAGVSRRTVWRWRNGVRVKEGNEWKIRRALVDEIGKEKILITQHIEK